MLLSQTATAWRISRPLIICSNCLFSSVASIADVSGEAATSYIASSKEKESKRKRLRDVTISEVLEAKHAITWNEPVISRDSSIEDAIKVCIDNKLPGMMVIDSIEAEDNKADSPTSENKKVLGMCTSRDLLRIMNKGFKEEEYIGTTLNRKVGDFMTPISQVVYARPYETIGVCRGIMAKLRLKCIPILSDGRVEGLITARDMSQYGLDATDQGGKKHYLESVSERVGLSSSTSMADPPDYLKAYVTPSKNHLYVNVGVAELPHPFKTSNSCDIRRRDFGAGDECYDISLSEDAHFSVEVKLRDETCDEQRQVTYMGVADGVGSWREFGVDSRQYSRILMAECKNILKEACGNTKKDDKKLNRIITPAEVIEQAHERVKAKKIIGSSTACVALIDGARCQLHFSNLGDCGIIVLRHIDSDIAGSLKRETKIPRALRTSDLRITFVSQQQLRSFNHPYQLGYTGEDSNDQEKNFESADDSCNSSIHIRRGDIILMATDGLFDNVELEDITKIVLDWEMKNGFGDLTERQKRWRNGGSMTKQSAQTIDDLAKTLVVKARENSLEDSRDSPFAILAKDNDIMWSGGMPDDCTVMALHVVGAPANVDATLEL